MRVKPPNKQFLDIKNVFKFLGNISNLSNRKQIYYISLVKRYLSWFKKLPLSFAFVFEL